MNQTYRFTRSKVDELKELNVKDLHIFLSLLLSSFVGYKKTINDRSLDEHNTYDVGTLRVALSKFCSRGLFKQQGNDFVYGDYDLEEKEILHFEEEQLRFLWSSLSPEEFFTYFNLLIASEVGAVTLSMQSVNKLAKRTFPKRVFSLNKKFKEVEDNLTIKGFLCPVIRISGHSKYRLFNGKGSLSRNYTGKAYSI